MPGLCEFTTMWAIFISSKLVSSRTSPGVFNYSASTTIHFNHPVFKINILTFPRWIGISLICHQNEFVFIVHGFILDLALRAEFLQLFPMNVLPTSYS